jgi:hypothetical protein
MSRVQMELYPTPLSPVYCYSQQRTIRCFPHCSRGQHYDKSFCGDSVMVTIHHSPSPTEEFGVFAEFHKADVGSSLGLYQIVSENEISNLLKATFVGWEAGIGARYSFNPNRKWEYRTTCPHGELHVLTVYYVVRSTILGMVGSTPFQLVPVQRIHDQRCRQRERRERNKQRPSHAEGTSRRRKLAGMQSLLECDRNAHVEQSDPLLSVDPARNEPPKSMSRGSPKTEASETVTDSESVQYSGLMKGERFLFGIHDCSVSELFDSI